MLRRRRTAAIRFPAVAGIKKCPVSRRLRLRWFPGAARLACAALLIIALARPRAATVLSEVSTEGVAIEVVVDRSGSMQAQMSYHGENANRLEVVKKVLSQFVAGGRNFSGRSGDLLGLVNFARYAETVCPLVHGGGVLLEFLKKTDIVKLRSEDGTAIGDAIALAAARLKNAEDQIETTRRRLGLQPQAGESFKITSKVIVLLTDGRNNTGEYEPLEAAELAKEWGIKIYAVGIGSDEAYTTVQTMMGAFKMPVRDDIDEDLLRRIAEATGGFYAKATDAESLEKIVEKIDSLEKTTVKSVQYARYSENFKYLALPALVLLVMEILSRCTVFRKIP
jgi:Ca-activated chloride channel family protein